MNNFRAGDSGKVEGRYLSRVSIINYVWYCSQARPANIGSENAYLTMVWKVRMRINIRIFRVKTNQVNMVSVCSI